MTTDLSSHTTVTDHDQASACLARYLFNLSGAAEYLST